MIYMLRVRTSIYIISYAIKGDDRHETFYSKKVSRYAFFAHESSDK